MTDVSDEEVEAVKAAMRNEYSVYMPWAGLLSKFMFDRLARAAIAAYNSTPGQAKMLEDAERYRWLTEDLTGAQKDARNELLERMSVMSYSAVSRDIDAARAAEGKP